MIMVVIRMVRTAKAKSAVLPIKGMTATEVMTGPAETAKVAAIAHGAMGGTRAMAMATTGVISTVTAIIVTSIGISIVMASTAMAKDGVVISTAMDKVLAVAISTARDIARISTATGTRVNAVTGIGRTAIIVTCVGMTIATDGVLSVVISTVTASAVTFIAIPAMMRIAAMANNVETLAAGTAMTMSVVLSIATMNGGAVTGVIFIVTRIAAIASRAGDEAAIAAHTPRVVTARAQGTAMRARAEGTAGTIRAAAIAAMTGVMIGVRAQAANSITASAMDTARSAVTIISARRAAIQMGRYRILRRTRIRTAGLMNRACREAWNGRCSPRMRKSVCAG
jgi:hypothetical protein